MTPPQARFGSWAIVGVLAAGIGSAMRVHNAFAYPSGKGFDAPANWEYIALLLERWQLPAPDAMWAASHPPLYYWLGAGVGSLVGVAGIGDGSEATVVPWIRLLGSILGLLAIGLGVASVRRFDPSPRRLCLMAALPLLLPVHLYSSAMLNEEVVAAAWVSAALVALLYSRRDGAPTTASVALVGVLAGLAFLTKVSGVLVLAAAAITYAVDGWRRDALASGVSRAAIVAGVGGVLGGWFFVHNLWVYGYLYPYKLDVHAIMATMPPGERNLFDYVYVPIATLLQPIVVGPELVRSVWGGTYASLWFDAHYHFLPRPIPVLVEWGATLCVLGLLPTVAFALGVVRGARRVLREPGGPDLPLLLILALTLVGYVAFTWRNPWFPTAKASYLLGLTLPFSYYASEVLADWTRPGRLVGALTRFLLGFLAVVSILTFTHGLVFEKHDDPGVPWQFLSPIATPSPQVPDF